MNSKPKLPSNLSLLEKQANKQKPPGNTVHQNLSIGRLLTDGKLVEQKVTGQVLTTLETPDEPNNSPPYQQDLK